MVLADTEMSSFLRQLGERTPVPGGGAVAAVIGAMAAAVGLMAMNYSLRTRTTDAVRRSISGAIEAMGSHCDRLLELADADAGAYQQLHRLQQLPESDKERIAEWDAAVGSAIEIPARILEESLDILGLCEGVAESCNRRLASDLAISAIAAQAAVRCASWNVRVNLPLLTDSERVSEIDRRIDRQLADAREVASKIEETCRRRMST